MIPPAQIQASLNNKSDDPLVTPKSDLTIAISKGDHTSAYGNTQERSSPSKQMIQKKTKQLEEQMLAEQRKHEQLQQNIQLNEFID